MRSDGTVQQWTHPGPAVRRVGHGLWTLVPAVLASGVLLGLLVALVALLTVGGDWTPSGVFVAIAAGALLGLVELVRVAATLVTYATGRWEGQWLSLAGWLAELPFALGELGFLGFLLYVRQTASQGYAAPGLGMSLVLFSLLSVFVAVPLALLVLGRVALEHRA